MPNRNSKTGLTASAVGHEVIDNRTVRLADEIRHDLQHSEHADFSLGQLFLPGLVPFVTDLSRLKSLRLLVDNVSSAESLEQAAIRLGQFEPLQALADVQRYPKRLAAKRMERELAEHLVSTVSRMDQTDETEAAIHALIDMLAGGRLKVRLHTHGPLAGRAYLFDPRSVSHDECPPDGASRSGAIVGSTNLCLEAVSGVSELNLRIQDESQRMALSEWFDELWGKGRRFEPALQDVLENSWAVLQPSPYEVFLKSLLNLVRDRLEDHDTDSVLWDDDINERLADFQKVAVEQAIQMIRRHGGAFVADVVGLGKSFIGAAIVKHFERTSGCRALIICPAALVDMWERYNEVYHLNSRVLSMGMLREDRAGGRNLLLDSELYRNRDFVLIDESHHFRHATTQRYRMVEEFLSDRKPCCFLTATPRNKSAWDVYTQMKLFHQDDRTDIPVTPPDLHEFFRQVENGASRLHDLLSHILIRRTRRDILKWYGHDSETRQPVDPALFHEYSCGQRRAYVRVGGRDQYFPKRELETIEYSIDAAYQGLYDQIRSIMGNGPRLTSEPDGKTELSYARYGLWHYLKPSSRNDDRYLSLQRAGISLRGLIRIMLFKRFESSVHAFRQTVQRMRDSHARFAQAVTEGVIPAGEDAEELLNSSADIDERDLLETLRGVAHQYSVTDFDVPQLIADLNRDISLLDRILSIVSRITPACDAKFRILLERLQSPQFQEGKCLIFTQFADTAQYLFDNLVLETGRDDMDVVCSSDRNRLQAVGRFAPRANPELSAKSSRHELNLLITTDALSEGLNLQDSDKIINYDLHWNPVRLIQRFGRIDRIGSEYQQIHGFNFLPETGIEQQLGLRQSLENRIREIHDTIGEDAAILHPSEQLNEAAMYAIYEQRGEVLDDLEAEDAADFGLNEATELFRLMQRDNPDEFERIVGLPDGIRCGVAAATGAKTFVHHRSGAFQELALFDPDGSLITRDLAEILATIRCRPEAAGLPVPAGHNAVVTSASQSFIAQMKTRAAERHHRVSLSRGQRYVLDQLRLQHAAADDEDTRERLVILEQAFRRAQSSAVTRELNRLRANHLAGTELYGALLDIYSQHNLRDRAGNPTDDSDSADAAVTVCSLALL